MPGFHLTDDGGLWDEFVVLFLDDDKVRIILDKCVSGSFVDLPHSDFTKTFTFFHHFHYFVDILKNSPLFILGIQGRLLFLHLNIRKNRLILAEDIRMIMEIELSGRPESLLCIREFGGCFLW